MNSNGTTVLEIHFIIDQDRLTVDDMIALEDAQDGIHPFHAIRNVLARFVKDESTGEIMDLADAQKFLGKLNLKQIMSVVDQFMAQIKSLKDNSIPPATGGQS